MARQKIAKGETDSDTVEEAITESGESTSTGKDTPQFLTMSLYKLSYKLLPKKCIKSSFLTLNTATFLAGLTAMIISIWMLTDSKLMSRLIGQRVYVTALLIVGIIATFIASIGILGFIKRKQQFLMMYIVLHTLFLFLIFVCSILSISLFDKLTASIRNDMTDSIENYRYLDWVTEAWDNTHRYLKCCGIYSYQDWDKYGMTIPQSCCATTVDKVRFIYCLSMTPDVVFKSGCLNGAIDFLKSSIHTVATLTLFVSIILFVNLFFALAIRKKFEAYLSSEELSRHEA